MTDSPNAAFSAPVAHATEVWVRTFKANFWNLEPLTHWGLEGLFEFLREEGSLRSL